MRPGRTSRQPPDTTRPTMFYDGSCPLCLREVNLYRRLDRARRVVWLDISRPDASLGQYGLTRDRAMRELHVLGEDGVLYRGAAAFPPIWALPYFRWLAPVFRLPGVLPALEFVYKPFARWRLRSRCTDGQCKGPMN